MNSKQEQNFNNYCVIHNKHNIIYRKLFCQLQEYAKKWNKLELFVLKLTL